MRLRRAFDALMHRARFERDMRDELHQHLDARTSDLIASGLSPTDAARQARVEFGAVERYKEQCRDARLGLPDTRTRSPLPARSVCVPRSLRSLGLQISPLDDRVIWGTITSDVERLHPRAPGLRLPAVVP